MFGFRTPPAAAAPAPLAPVRRIADWEGQHVFIEATALVRNRFPEAQFQIIGAPLFGQVVIEGIAAGKPIVATNGGALPEIVIPGETGLLVPMGDAPALAVAIESLLANPSWGTALGAVGRRRVHERFMIAQTAGKVEHVCEHLLHGRPSALRA